MYLTDRQPIAHIKNANRPISHFEHIKPTTSEDEYVLDLSVHL